MNRDRITPSAPGSGSPAPPVPSARLALYGQPADRVTLEVLAEQTRVHPQRILDYVEFGLLDPCERVGERLFFASTAVVRLRRIERLRLDLGVNLTGISIILDMRERLQRLQRELERKEL
jgi:DNA-binding transcriptional MerR regulator